MKKWRIGLALGLAVTLGAAAQPEPEPDNSNCAYDLWFMHVEKIDGCSLYMKCPHRIICWQDESGTRRIPSHGTTMQIVRCDVYVGGVPGPNGKCIGGQLAPPSMQVFFTPPIPAQFCDPDACEGSSSGGGEQ
ncbi:MAG: hypothetical protein IT439_11415 [Phycisphaerales bacterium]|nr:hypothetical protein [Phycisphaerales bacterium]